MCTDANRESLIAFVYDELPLDERRAFETHMAACATCRGEVSGLREVRDDLLAWAPPECRDLPSSWAEAPLPAPTAMDRLRGWAPAFGLAAAAMLLLAVSAAIANLEVRIGGSEGFVVRTGRGATADIAPAAFASAPRVATASVTAADLTELEERLRRTFDEAGTRAPLQTVALSSNNPQLTRDMRRLIEEAERRVREEMAAQLISIYNQWDARQRGDEQGWRLAINQMERRTAAELANQRNEINRLMLAVQGQGQK